MASGKAIFKIEPRIDLQPVAGFEKVRGVAAAFMHPGHVQGKGAVGVTAPSCGAHLRNLAAHITGKNPTLLLNVSSEKLRRAGGRGAAIAAYNLPQRTAAQRQRRERAIAKADYFM